MAYLPNFMGWISLERLEGIFLAPIKQETPGGAALIAAIPPEV